MPEIELPGKTVRVEYTGLLGAGFLFWSWPNSMTPLPFKADPALDLNITGKEDVKPLRFPLTYYEIEENEQLFLRTGLTKAVDMLLRTDGYIYFQILITQLLEHGARNLELSGYEYFNVAGFPFQVSRRNNQLLLEPSDYPADIWSGGRNDRIDYFGGDKVHSLQFPLKNKAQTRHLKLSSAEYGHHFLEFTCDGRENLQYSALSLLPLAMAKRRQQQELLFDYH